MRLNEPAEIRQMGQLALGGDNKVGRPRHRSEIILTIGTLTSVVTEECFAMKVAPPSVSSPATRLLRQKSLIRQRLLLAVPVPPSKRHGSHPRSAQSGTTRHRAREGTAGSAPCPSRCRRSVYRPSIPRKPSA